MDLIEERYLRYQKTTGTAVAAAILVLAAELGESIAGPLEGMTLGHQICMGIRHGLWGGDASDEATIREFQK